MAVNVLNSSQNVSRVRSYSKMNKFILKSVVKHFNKYSHLQPTFFTFISKHDSQFAWWSTVLWSIYTGRFIVFSVITNIYNKKTEGPTLTFKRRNFLLNFSTPCI